MQRGFTLIEVAVVVFIVAILLGSLVAPFVSRVKQAQYEETTKTMADIKEAIIGFAVINGRLPRPATSATSGVEVASCATNAACTGFIPWTTLGVPKLDAYGKLFKYSVGPAYTSTFTLSTTVIKSVSERLLASPYSFSVMVSDAPAVICSHGADNWGTSEAGTAISDNSATNTDEDINAAGTITFVHRPRTDNTAATGGEFDDICTWIPRATLMNRMIAGGKLP